MQIDKMDSIDVRSHKDNEIQNELTVTQAQVYIPKVGEFKGKSAVPRVVTENISSIDVSKFMAAQQNIDLKLNRPSLQKSDTMTEPDETDKKYKYYRVYYSKK